MVGHTGGGYGGAKCIPTPYPLGKKQHAVPSLNTFAQTAIGLTPRLKCFYLPLSASCFSFSRSDQPPARDPSELPLHRVASGPSGRTYIYMDGGDILGLALQGEDPDILFTKGFEPPPSVSVKVVAAWFSHFSRLSVPDLWLGG